MQPGGIAAGEEDRCTVVAGDVAGDVVCNIIIIVGVRCRRNQVEPDERVRPQAGVAPVPAADREGEGLVGPVL